MKKNLVIFKLQTSEKVNAYSIVDNETLKTIPENIILIKQKVDDKLYSKLEIEEMRNQLVGGLK